MLLRRTPAAQRALVVAYAGGVVRSQIPLPRRIRRHVEELRAPGGQLADELHRTVAQSDESERVVGEEQRNSRLVVQHRASLRSLRRLHAEQVEHRRRRVDQADDATAANLIPKQSWCGNDERHMDVFLVELKRVAEVAVV